MQPASGHGLKEHFQEYGARSLVKGQRDSDGDGDVYYLLLWWWFQGVDMNLSRCTLSVSAVYSRSVISQKLSEKVREEDAGEVRQP